MCEAKKKSIMAHSICYSVYTLTGHYLYRDFNVSVTIPERSLGGVGRLSLLDLRGNLTGLCSTGSHLPDSTSFPRLFQETPAHSPGAGTGTELCQPVPGGSGLGELPAMRQRRG